MNELLRVSVKRRLTRRPARRGARQPGAEIHRQRRQHQGAAQKRPVAGRWRADGDRLCIDEEQSGLRAAEDWEIHRVTCCVDIVNDV